MNHRNGTADFHRGYRMRIEGHVREKHVPCQWLTRLSVFGVVTLLTFGAALSVEAISFKHPFQVWPDTISICFLPFQTPETTSPVEAIRMPVSNLLSERDDFNYEFWLPSLAQSREIYEKGFVQKGELWSGRPRFDYWYDYDVQYLAFGTYSVRGEELVVEFYFYDLGERNPCYGPQPVTLLFAKRYKVSVQEVSLLHDRITTDTISALENEGRHPRRPE